MGRAIESFLEDSVESIGSKLHDANKIHHSDRGMQVYGYIRFDAACLPWRHHLAPYNHLLIRGRLIRSCSGYCSALVHACHHSLRRSSIVLFAVGTIAGSWFVE